MKRTLVFVLAVIMLASMASCGSGGGGSDGDSARKANNTIEWNSDFFGVETIPSPDGFDKVADYNAKTDNPGNNWAIIKIDGMGWNDFVNYCKKLEALEGWTSKEGSGVADLPEAPSDTARVGFEGSLGDIGEITLYYYSDIFAAEKDNTNLLMYVYEWAN